VSQEVEIKATNVQDISWRALNLPLTARGSLNPLRRQEIIGEYGLTDALLREAIREFQKFAGYKSRRGAKLFREVDQWFSADDHESCFSFINVCRILDLEPTYIRTGLKMWRERNA
jgi:hypothetical protein